MRTIREARPGTVNVLIGPNGSGKSRRLRRLCDEALAQGSKVIAVSSTIFDRFLAVRSSNFRFFGARQGRTAAKNVIRDALVQAADDKPQILKSLTRVLEYTGFEPAVGVSIKWIDLARLDEVLPQLDLETQELEELQFFLRGWGGSRDWDKRFPWTEAEEWKGKVILKFSMERFSFRELHGLNYLSALGHESLLVKNKIIARPKYYFFRRGRPIPLLQACSGELWFVTAMAFIAIQIEGECCIVVDEPENSLHPTWQKSYISTFLDLFHKYQPRVVFATHSPIIVSGGEVTDQKTRVFEMSGGDSEEFSHANLNLEEMYERLFDLVTPKNHYLSRRSVELLNQLNAGEIKVSDVIREFDSLAEKSYDEKQLRVIGGLKEIARRIDEDGAKHD
jgi:predicted ATPase/energy-coupling factor transporter ATP-binding protein EcfA2